MGMGMTHTVGNGKPCLKAQIRIASLSGLDTMPLSVFLGEIIQNELRVSCRCIRGPFKMSGQTRRAGGRQAIQPEAAKIIPLEYPCGIATAS